MVNKPGISTSRGGQVSGHAEKLNQHLQQLVSRIDNADGCTDLIVTPAAIATPNCGNITLDFKQQGFCDSTPFFQALRC